MPARPIIQDEFTNLPISRQQKYRLRMRRDGRCRICGEPAAGAQYCLKHLVQTREYTRKTVKRVKRKRLKRYTASMSYRLEQAAADKNRGNP